MKQKSTISLMWWQLLFPVSQVILIWFGLLRPKVSGQIDPAIKVILVLFCILADITIFFAVRFIRNKARETVRLETELQYVEMQEEYYAGKGAYYERLRTLRHDSANHIYTLQILLKEGKFDEAAAYAHALRKEVKGK